MNLFQSTLLHCAAFSAGKDVVNWLLNAGANGLARDSRQRTPLHEACSKANLPAVEALLSHEDKEEWINTRDYKHCTPLLTLLIPEPPARIPEDAILSNDVYETRG